MSNAFAGDVILSEGSSFLFKDPATGTIVLAIVYTAVDPNGTLTAPTGSIAAGPSGMWVNTGGTTWSVSSPSSQSGPVLVWSLGVPWSTIEAQLAVAGMAGIVLVEGDPDGTTARLMTRSAIDPLGITDLSRVLFVGVNQGTDTFPARGPVLVKWDYALGAEFQLGVGGGLNSQNILWQYGIGIGAATGPMSHINWIIDGGGIQALEDTWVVRLGKPIGKYSFLTLRNGAELATGTITAPGAMFMINHMGPPLPPKAVLSFIATTGAVIGPNSFYSPPVIIPPNPPMPGIILPYAVPSVIDASVQYDPLAHGTPPGNYSIRSSTNLDQAYQVSFDPAIGGVLVATDVQGAIDEIVTLIPTLPTVASVNLPGQTGAVPQAPLVTTPQLVESTWRVSCYAATTVVGAGPATPVVYWSDETGPQSASAPALSLAGSGYTQGVWYVRCAAFSSIDYAVTTPGITPPGEYSVTFTAERVT